MGAAAVDFQVATGRMPLQASGPQAPAGRNKFSEEQVAQLAAYVASLLFGLAHYDSFLLNPLHLAIAQQIYAFAWGLAYVWLMEKSDSLLAPTIAHGLSDMVEVGAVIALAAAMPV